jgi:hypothetical protein
MRPFEVVKALEEGKKLRRTFWNDNSWIELDGDVIRQYGEGWENPTKPYKEIWHTLFSGGWYVME